MLLSLLSTLLLVQQTFAAAGQQELEDREIEAEHRQLERSDLGLDTLPHIVGAKRQSVGAGGVSASTGNISASAGNISLEVGDITIQVGNITLEDIVLGNVVVIVDVGIGAPADNSTTNGTSTSSASSGAATRAAGREDATVITTVENGEEEIEIITVFSQPSTSYTFTEEPSTTTIVELSSTHLELDDGDYVTIRERAAPTPPPVRPLAARAASIDPSVSVGPVSVGVGDIGATIGNINVTVGDVFVGLGDIEIKDVTIGNVYVSVNIQANLKRSEDSQPTVAGVRIARALPEPRQTASPDKVEKMVMPGIYLPGKAHIKRSED